MNRRILVVENSQIMSRLIKNKLEESERLAVDIANSLEAVKELLDRHAGDYFMAVANLKLPDAMDGQAVEEIGNQAIPTVVLTSSIDEDTRKRMYSKHVIDYIIKEGQALDNIVETVRRLRKNQGIKVMIVDDSRFSRNNTGRLLARQLFDVVSAKDGIEALEMFEKHPDVKLVITDFHMPRMDGYELCLKLRQLRNKDSLVIIGVSSSEEDFLTAKFIKAGANDFLKKPFGTEEFYCRIACNLDFVDMVQQIKEASNTDYLTKLFNRRYFFDVGRRTWQRALKDCEPVALAMMDIDHFKSVNDNYGHDGGDKALVEMAQTLKGAFRPADVIARFGGEEFCCLLPGMSKDTALMKLETLRETVEALRIPHEGQIIKYTISIGLAMGPGADLDELITTADKRLYAAKEGGRNQIVYS